jgi:hypothetical protein
MRRWLMALNLLVCSSAAGCAMFEQRAEYLHYETVLEDGKTVRLMEYSQINQALRGPANNYAIAVLHVLSSRGAMLWTERVAFREGIDAMPAFDPKDVEVRTDGCGSSTGRTSASSPRSTSTACSSPARTTPSRPGPDWTWARGFRMAASRARPMMVRDRTQKHGG